MQHEVRAFAGVVYERFGYDFRHYRLAALTSRLAGLCARLQLPGVPALQAWLLQNPAQIGFVVDQICIPISDLFREPETFADLRDHVFPALRSFASLTIWHAGCAAGQEAYSMAILLEESGMLARSRIFASDLSSEALTTAALGQVSARQVEAAEARYRSSGGTGGLARHFISHGATLQLAPELMSRITFVRHNLATDAVFCEANLILCCNVLIYFERPLQARVLELFSDSLVRGGHLCLGQRESPIGAGARFAKLPGSAWVYRPTAAPRPQIWGARPARGRIAAPPIPINDGGFE